MKASPLVALDICDLPGRVFRYQFECIEVRGGHPRSCVVLLDASSIGRRRSRGINHHPQ